MGRKYIALRIKSKRNSAFVVGFIDTGADETVISPRAAKRIKAEKIGIFRALSASKNLETGKPLEIVGDLTEIEIEDCMNGKSSMLRCGISEEPFDYEEEDVDVIVGLDFLQGNGMVLDFRKRRREV